jgi:ammonia channel protein AmtB
VTGLFYGDASQFLAQGVDVVTNVVVVFGLTYVFFRVLNAVMGMRVPRAQELAGLDIPEMGSLGYAPDVPVPGGQVVEPLAHRAGHLTPSEAGAS